MAKAEHTAAIQNLSDCCIDSRVHLPLYKDAKVTLLDTLAKHFEWFTSHPGTSKEALSNMLSMEHSILPENNILPKTYSLALQQIQPYLIRSQVFHACRNDCILFRKKYENATVCPMCKSERYKHNAIPFRKFVYLPLGPRIIRMFEIPSVAQILQSHMQGQDRSMYDIHDSPTWQAAYAPHGVFDGDKRGLSFALCTDGVNPFSHNRVAYSMWPIMLTLLNLPRNIRNSFSSMFLVGIIPSNGAQEPKHLDPYLDVVIDELLELSNVDAYDAYKDEHFKLKAEILLYILDYPAMGKVFKMSGTGAYKGCIWCEIKGMYAYNAILVYACIICNYVCIDIHIINYVYSYKYLKVN